MNKRKIELFTAGCVVCAPVVDLVKSVASKEFNEITIYDLVKQCDTKECVAKVEEYQIKRLPAIAINGKLMDCCTLNSITKEDLINAGVAESI